MENIHDLPARLGRRDWLKGCAAGALCLGARASFAQNPGAYSVVLLGDTHYDAHPASTYHSHYDNDRKAEWLWRVQRAEFMRNGDMWAERCPRLLKASAACLPSDARFVLQLGDLVQGDCDDQPTHKRMLDDAMQLMKRAYSGNLPFVVVEGNHDIRGDGARTAYHEWSNATMGRELGQTVASTTFSFRQGPDAWVVVDFNCPDPDLINRLVDETQGARHLFLVSHGPLLFSDTNGFRWSLLGAAKYDEARRALIAKLMRRRAIIFFSFSYRSFNFCLINRCLVEYWFAVAAGHATLSVTDRSVKASFFPGDARAPSQVFELASGRA